MLNLQAVSSAARTVRALGPSVVIKQYFGRRKGGVVQVETPKGSFALRRGDSDFHVLKQVYVDCDYDLMKFMQGASVWGEYEAIIARGNTPVIVDAGANIGLSSHFFGSAYPGATVFAIEPSPANAAICRQNVRSVTNVRVVEAAIGSSVGHVSLRETPNSGWATQTERASNGGISIVTITSLLSNIPDSELLIAKVDIEGFESDLFSGDTSWAADAAAIIIEPHDWMMPGRGTSHAFQKVMAGLNRDLLISGENLIWINTQTDIVSQRARA